jgi:hypothetical protein
MFISIKKKTALGFKTMKDQCTSLIGADTAGNFNMKPLMVYHTKNPQAFKFYAKGCPLNHSRAN